MPKQKKNESPENLEFHLEAHMGITEEGAAIRVLEVKPDFKIALCRQTIDSDYAVLMRTKDTLVELFNQMLTRAAENYYQQYTEKKNAKDS